MTLHFIPVLPLWLVLLVSAGLLGVLAHGSITLLRRQVPRRPVLVLAILRSAIALLFALILLHPVLSWTRTAQRRPEMLVLIDTSESMAQPGGLEGASRLEESVRTLDAGLVKNLGRRYDLRFFSFDRSASPLEGKEWTVLSPNGSATHYADSLTQACNHPRVSSASPLTPEPKPERVLLVSDGRDRGSTDIVEAARRLGVAIDVLAPGTPLERTEAAPVTIAEVQGAGRVLLGSETHFLVTLRTDPAPADRKVILRMAEGGKEHETAEVTIRAGRSEERFRLAHRPGEAGPKRFEFRLGDGTVLPLSIQVIDGKHEVLVLEDSWRWEFKFLRRVLEEDPSFRFTALLSRGGGAFMQFAAPDRRSQLVGFPQERSQLAGFDTVIIGDVNPKRWPRHFATSLRRLVVDEGKSLVVQGGPNLAHWIEVPELLSLLPVEITRETANPVVGPVPIRVSSDGARSPFLFLDPGNPTQTSLPPLDQVYPPLRKKPAATVLLEAARLGNPYGPLIVIAEHTAGRGRVLYVGTDTLWKWQTLSTATDANTTPYHRFWQQSLRALAPLRPGGAAVNLWLQPQRSRYEVGQRATVRAEIDSVGRLPQASVRGVVSLPNGQTFPLSFAADPATPNVFSAEFETKQPGAYRLTALADSAGRLAAEGATVLDIDPARPERDGSPPDLSNLTRIASSTGGQVIDPTEPATWPASKSGPSFVTERVTVDLWNRAYLLVVLAVVAGIDWLMRLLRGYV